MTKRVLCRHRIGCAVDGFYVQLSHIIYNLHYYKGCDYVKKTAVVSERFPLRCEKKPFMLKVDGKKLEYKTALAFRRLKKAAEKEGISLKLLSGYRSASYQKMLFDNSVKEYMAGGMKKAQAVALTQRYIARPLCSEHNAGVACDIVRACDDDTSDSFCKTPEYAWLILHSWAYGFILRYPRGKEDITGVNFEPWHFRFVGRKCAQIITRGQICLEEYDSFQRFYCKK